MIRIANELLLTSILATSMAAQDIPPHMPVNPVEASRSAIYAQPIVRPQAGWQFRTLLDYSSAVEVSADGSREFTLDAELLTVDFWARRDLSPDAFMFIDVPVRNAYNGGLDRPINAYHHFTGLLVPARDRLPINTFDWHEVLPDTTVTYHRPGAFLGDIRVGAGWRMHRMQLVASLTLPTATITADGWTRKTIGTAIVLTDEAVHSRRWNLELGATGGWTPTTGALAKYQRSVFLGAFASARWRFSEHQALYTTLWAQSGPWQHTGFRSLGDPDVTLDFGALLRLGAHLPELQLGVTEDLYPRGPAVDLGLRVGVRWE